MTKEQLEDRIKTLTQDRDNLKATIIAYEGAIQDCMFWIQEIDKPKEEVTKAKKDK